MPVNSYFAALDAQQALNQRKRQEEEYNSPEAKRIRAFQLMNLEDTERQKAMITDARQAKTLIANGDTQGAMKLLGDRAQQISQLGGNARETMEVYEALRANKPQDALGMINNFLQIASGQDMKPKKQPELQYKEGGLVFNPATGEVSVNETATQHLARLAEKKLSGGELTLSDKRAINGDVTKLLKDTTLIHKTANDLAKLQKMPSGPASIALVFKFMKALDPTSVVREGEFATAENSAGVPEGVRNMYNRFMNGERLGENQIQQFVATAQGLSNSAVEASRAEIGNYLQVYGDSLPAQFIDKVYGRIPSLFEQQELSTKDNPDDPNAINPKSNITPWSEL